ncbi:MAG: NB-ARC domain-containing protein, partial [Cyanobacteria bacterium P01_D01_bin.56]
MFSEEFLLQIADTYGLTADQKEVFCRRLLKSQTHQSIAQELGIQQSACLRRMAEVYKKFQIEGSGRGKDKALRNMLIAKRERLDEKIDVSVDIASKLNSLTNRVAAIEENTAQSPDPGLSKVLTPTGKWIISSRDSSPDYRRHNLPHQTNEFIGRKEELNRLLQKLSETNRNPVITVDGIGGVGKTSLVVEAAYQCLNASKANRTIPKFEAIIFVSAKESYLTPAGILQRQQSQNKLDDIYKAIAFTLNIPSILKASGPSQDELVKQALSEQTTLLIVDTFETIEEEDKQEILSFLYELPSTVKSVITSREQRVIHVSIRLDNLSEQDSLKLIQQQIQEKDIELSDSEQRQLLQASGGIPLVIVYAIGLLANSWSLESILENLESEDLNADDNDLACFLFQQSVDELRKSPAYKLLLALSVFQKAPQKHTLVSVAGLEKLSKSTIDKHLSSLKRLSLIRQYGGRYRMLALTREYALAKLNQDLEFKKQTCARFYDWYLNFAKEYGGDDWGEWHHKYDYLQEEWGNFISVLEWCATNGEYLKVRELWRYLTKYASLYGFWNDRLNWLNWLIQASERRADWETFVEMTTAYSWTLILKETSENLTEADRMQQRAWKLHEHATPVAQYILAENIAVLRIRQNKYTEAREWFNRYKCLVEQAELDTLQSKRSEIRFLYYTAEILYKEREYK